MVVVDLSADLGEIEGDVALTQVVTSASIACGGHAGDRRRMESAVAACLEAGVAIGAHPSYLDRESFGRAERSEPASLVAAQVASQVELLARIAEKAGGQVSYVKLHGALYHRANSERELAEAILDSLPELHVLSQRGALLDLARLRGWPAVEEGFCDRAYDRAGRLVDRRLPGALLEPEAAVSQALALARAGRFGSLCLHGDSPGARSVAEQVRLALTGAGVELRSFAEPTA